MDGETFMISNLLTTFDAVCTAKVLIILVPYVSVQYDDDTVLGVIGQSGREDRLR
jgi:hypothetical protein